MFKKNKNLEYDELQANEKEPDIKELEASLDFLKEKAKAELPAPVAADNAPSAPVKRNNLLDTPNPLLAAPSVTAAKTEVQGLKPLPAEVRNDGLKPLPDAVKNDGLKPLPEAVKNDGLKGSNEAHTVSDAVRKAMEVQAEYEKKKAAEEAKRSEAANNKGVYTPAGKEVNNAAGISVPAGGDILKEVEQGIRSMSRMTGATLLNNPLPHPRRHISRNMDFDVIPTEAEMHFDVEDMTGMDYFDLDGIR